MFETADGLHLNFWYQRQKSQYQSQFFRPIYKDLVLVSVSLSKIETRYIKSQSQHAKTGFAHPWEKINKEKCGVQGKYNHGNY